MTSDELTLLQKLHNGHSLQLGEFCMATGTLVSSVLETCLQQQGLDLHLSVNLMSEMIEWKREVCADMHRNVMRGQSPQLELVSRTADLAAQRPVKTCNVAVAAIECDDVSSCSTTPRSILDRGGRSGSSFLEFIDWVTTVPHQARPSFILMECVSGLGRLRRLVGKEVSEAPQLPQHAWRKRATWGSGSCSTAATLLYHSQGHVTMEYLCGFLLDWGQRQGCGT